MLKSKRSLRKEINNLVRVDRGVELHPSWRGGLTLAEAAQLLKGNAPFTYVMTQGFDQYHYFLTYVDADGKVKHRNVRSAIKNGKTFYWNGGGGTGGGGYESIDNLVPGCLNCSATVCRPL